MKKIHNIVFAIATVVFMLVSFAGCDNDQTPPLSIVPVHEEEGWENGEKYNGMRIALVNRSATETLVLRTDFKDKSYRVIIIPPGDSETGPCLHKGEIFTITADGYSKPIEGMAPLSFD